MTDIAGLVDRIVSHAMESGLFETVNGHEPKSAPGKGLICAVWAQSIGPARGGSGLSATSGRVEFNVRLYTNMLSEPQDAIDPTLLGATDTLLGLYSGDFDLGGTVREIDLLGSFGNPLGAQAGYLTQDGKLYRVITITLPAIINDIWSQNG